MGRRFETRDNLLLYPATTVGLSPFMAGQFDGTQLALVAPSRSMLDPEACSYCGYEPVYSHFDDILVLLTIQSTRSIPSS